MHIAKRDMAAYEVVDSGCANATVAEDEEIILSRHRKERKELQAKIQTLKKSKVDKKKKKELHEEIVRLEAELDARQAEELNAFNSLKISETAALTATNSESDIEPPKHQGSKLSKAQRRRDKKSQEDREREAQIKAEEKENRNSPRILEDKKLAEILSNRGLESYTVPADGDCLYNAVKHQLSRLGISDYDTTQLREMAADYIEDNKDNIICYMTNPDTGDILGEDEFRRYCHQVRNTKAWGGEIEVKALSSSLKCPIEIIQASGTSPIHGEDQDLSRKLILTYHRHMYRLGEHYNSTIAATEKDSQSEDEQQA